MKVHKIWRWIEFNGLPIQINQAEILIKCCDFSVGCWEFVQLCWVKYNYCLDVIVCVRLFLEQTRCIFDEYNWVGGDLGKFREVSSIWLLNCRRRSWEDVPLWFLLLMTSSAASHQTQQLNALLFCIENNKDVTAQASGATYWKRKEPMEQK